MSITLSIPPAIVQEVREWAEANGTSLNQYIRDCLFHELLASDVTIDLVRRAVAVKEEYGIQFYDALIVATASKLGCHEIVSEDLNPGRVYCGMAVVNPFLQ